MYQKKHLSDSKQHITLPDELVSGVIVVYVVLMFPTSEIKITMNNY